MDIKIDPERSCFHCVNFQLCFLRHRLEGALLSAGILNIDSEDAPGKMTDIYFAVGNACLSFFKKRKKLDKGD
jgi:hypothetical protein